MLHVLCAQPSRKNCSLGNKSIFYNRAKVFFDRSVCKLALTQAKLVLRRRNSTLKTWLFFPILVFPFPTIRKRQ